MLLSDEKHAQGQNGSDDDSFQSSGNQRNAAASAHQPYHNGDDRIDHPCDLVEGKHIFRIDPDINIRQ